MIRIVLISDPKTKELVPLSSLWKSEALRILGAKYYRLIGGKWRPLDIHLSNPIIDPEKTKNIEEDPNFSVVYDCITKAINEGKYLDASKREEESYALIELKGCDKSKWPADLRQYDWAGVRSSEREFNPSAIYEVYLLTDSEANRWKEENIDPFYDLYRWSSTRISSIKDTKRVVWAVFNKALDEMEEVPKYFYYLDDDDVIRIISTIVYKALETRKEATLKEIVEEVKKNILNYRRK